MRMSPYTVPSWFHRTWLQKFSVRNKMCHIHHRKQENMYSSSFLFDITLSFHLPISRFCYLSIAPYSVAPFNRISVLYSLWLQPVSYPPSSNQTQTAKRRPRYPGPQVFSQARAVSRDPAHLPLLSNHSAPLTFTCPLPPAASWLTGDSLPTRSTA